ncbi:glycine--tRNA ligase [Ureaplasma zalophigenitalium]|uniref:Glycine--tRNA ligase n=1 Tax=Ureaplasma zalophigenitalium TaxID=907723 RepID=A0ABT3BPI8_9BACT|nr:glycine--tRNA ligase [Ureaplasma zalophigenitalium]MCV3754181.1 glycine--tRNA ligase [Ureaplasma zalophigenitalium]
MQRFKKAEDIVNHLKQTGFVFANSEIYNGLANAWDYGPLGVILKNNLKNLWWKHFVNRTPDVYGLDSAIINNPLVWQASGHLDNFSDPLIDCKNCQTRYRADKMINQIAQSDLINEKTSNQDIQNALVKFAIKCENCKQQSWTDVRYFNLMFKTNMGVIDDNKNIVYLRPETAQGIFVNFKNIQRAMRLHLPFGVAQIGKSFRNEITPGNFIFRTREFEQMEIEYFLHANDAYNVFDQYENKIYNWLTKECNLDEDKIRKHEHSPEELAHYSAKTIDFEYEFLFGFQELYGLAYRGDYDLNQHMQLSKKDLTYLDENTKTKFVPHVVEPSVGVERLFYAIATNHLLIESLADDEERIVFNLPYELAPYKLAVLPLSNKFKDQAFKFYQKLLNQDIVMTFDAAGSIGKRYRRQDAIGTIYCLTVDFDSFNENQEIISFTIRERNSMNQKRITLEELPAFLSKQGHSNFNCE